MATIVINDAGKVTYAGTTLYSSMSKVGTTYDTSEGRVCVTRYQFQTDGCGATGLSFQTTTAWADIGGGSADDSVGRMRFAIGTDPTQYVGHKATDNYAAAGAYGVGISGSLSIKLLPNTTYYLWIYPAGNFHSNARFEIGNCTVTTSGTYGQASGISVSNGTFGSRIPITLTNSINGTTNTLTVTCGGITKTLLTDSTAMSASWTPALGEYGAALPNAKSATATFTVTTSYNGAPWGSTTKSITVSFPSSAGPSISAVTLTPYNTGTKAAVINDPALFVQGYSRVRAAVTAAGKYSATISAYQLTVEGVSTSRAASPVTGSNAVTTAGSVKATVKVTDSRGFTASTTKTFTVQAYANPSITGASLRRCSESGAVSETGTCLRAYGVGNISSLGGQNTMSMTVAYRTTAGSFPTTETAMVSETARILSGLNADTTYVARITLTDKLGNSAAVTGTINSQKWAMKFNSSGTAVGFGMAPQAAKVLEIPADWNIQRGTQTALFSNGGTVTGNLTVQKNAPYFVTRSGNMDAQIGQTVPEDATASLGGTAFYDSAEYNFARDTVYKTTSDLLYRYIWLRRRDADGNVITNGFSLRINKNGVQTVDFADGSRDAWRSALGVGNVGGLSAINGLFAVEQKSFITSAQTVAAGGSINGTLSVAKSGYTALGPVGYYIQSAALALVWNYMSAANTYRWAIGNPTGSSQSIGAAHVYILYVKNST